MAKKTLLILLALTPLIFPICADESVDSNKDSVVAVVDTGDQSSDVKPHPLRKSTLAEAPAPQKQDDNKDAIDDSFTDDEANLPTPMPNPPNLSGETNYTKQFTGTLIAILVVVFLVLLIIWLMRRFSNNRPLHMNHRKHIKILEKRPLSPNTYVYLVEIGDKQFCIAESKFQVSNVCTLDWTETDPDR